MARTLRSKKLRYLLWQDAGGKCKLCDCQLDPDNWHADHIVPYSRSKRTNVHEMQALCPACNLNKGENMPKYDGTELRENQKQDISAVIDAVTAGQDTTTIVDPPRSGKTNSMQLASQQLVEDEIVSIVFALTPSVYLADQFTSKSDLEKYAERYKPQFRRNGFGRVTGKSFIRVKGTMPDWAPNNEALLVMTTQLAVHHMDAFIDKLNELSRRLGGAPVLVNVDECQMHAARKRYGELISRIVAAGHKVALWTGLAYREDGDDIPGFATRDVDTWNDEIKQTRRDDDTLKWFRKTYDRTRVLRELIPDHETPLSEAFAAGILSDMKITFLESEWATFLDGALAGKVRYQDLSLTEQAKLLRQFTDDPRTIEASVDVFLHDLAREQGMIISNADDQYDSDVDAHAMKIRTAIRGRVTSKVITMSVDKPSELLAQFRAGGFRVAIVKGMGVLGFDNPNMKTILDLSTVRTLSAKLQAWLRVANAGEQGRVIVPHDTRAENVWDYINGNLEKARQRITELELKEEEEVPPPPPPPDEDTEHRLDGLTGLTVHHKNCVPVEYGRREWGWGQSFMAELGDAGKSLTVEAICNARRAADNPKPTVRAPVNTSAVSRDFKADCQSLINKQVNGCLNQYEGGRRELFGEYSKAAFWLFRRKFGCHHNDNQPQERHQEMRNFCGALSPGEIHASFVEKRNKEATACVLP